MKNLKIFTTNIDEKALDQINKLMEQPAFCDAKVRIMPDVHAGSGCTIGFTADLKDKVIPNVVGVDIGCGMYVTKLNKDVDLDLEKLDQVIHKYVPSDLNVHDTDQISIDVLKELRCFPDLKKTNWLLKSLYSLGSGNHFIEVDIDDEGYKYLVIHTGSRNLGKQVCNHYQNKAIEIHSRKNRYNEEVKEIVERCNKENRRSDIQKEIKAFKEEFENRVPDMPKDLCYLEGSNRDDYLFDMKICQGFAKENRKGIAKIILDHMDIKEDKIIETFDTIHNYISFEDNIVRKGAISARLNEKLIIPINMRDGCIIGIGKGNDDWNNSAPHGAGRIMTRAKAFNTLKLEDYKESMEGIYTSSVSLDTIDEAPMVYKPMQEIIDNIKDTVDIIKIIKPIYNFKASDKERP